MDVDEDKLEIESFNKPQLTTGGCVKKDTYYEKSTISSYANQLILGRSDV